ncbi:MAG: hypothetical protein HXN93_00110, partial [Prevotella pleuritidis]|nr:hypothetical protein [Hoylesella pleuritidis]
MDRHHHKILLLLLIVSILLVIAPRSVFAGELDTLQVTVNHDAKSIESESETPLDTLQKTVLQNTPKKKPVRDWATWHPNPKRALWLALVLPGAGQIYNRKYWKLPLVYGGFVGCVYAMRWNDQMYHDYSQAYLDISDDDPNTQSYNQFLHLGKAITKENMATYQNLFKQRKDRYRRWRDLSFFCLLGVYALSVIDAYVDASLSEFDISNNLSLRVEPAIINNRISRNPFTASAVGLQ